MSARMRGGWLAPRALAAARAVFAGCALLWVGAGCFVPAPKPSPNRAMLGQLAPDLRLQ